MKKVFAFIFFVFVSFSVFAKESAYTLCPFGTVLYNDNGNGALEAVAQLPAGTFLELDSTDVVYRTVFAHNKKYENVGVYKVAYENESYYVSTYMIAIGDNLLAMTEETTIFDKPRISAFSSKTIRQDALVIAGKTIEHARHRFTEIQYFSESQGIVKTGYVLFGKTKNYVPSENASLSDFATEK